MSELDIETEQTEQTEQVFNFATIGAVYADGVSLIFDGTTEASEKHYKCNAGAPLAAGDRVRIIKDSGTYVVEYAVGAPLARAIPAAGTDGQALLKNGATNFALVWGTPSAGVPSIIGTDSNRLTMTDGAWSSNPAVLTPSQTDHIDLGAASAYMRYGYFERLYLMYNQYTSGYLSCNYAGKLCWNGTAIT